MPVKKKKKAKPVGRPTKYSSKMLNKAIDYVNGGYKETGNGEVIPMVCGLALYLNVNRSTIYEWVKDNNNPEFSDTLSQLSDFQQLNLVNKGLTGDFNPQIAKLMLSHNHGISEGQKEEEEAAPPLTINFNVKEAQSEISTTNAKP